MHALMAPRRLLLLLAVVLAQLGALACETLRGAVTCLDCAPGRDLSGVVVAVKCGVGDGAGLHAAQTDDCGNFEVAVPAAQAASRCAARVLGGPEQLCAPQRFTVARVVAAGQEPGSYVLGSRLAVFTRCGALATMVARPRAGRSSPPYDLGLPLIYFFPFIPIIGIP